MKILLYSFEIVGTSMAGPAIRYWEFAQALSKHHEVILLTPNQPDITSSTFTIRQYNRTVLAQEMQKADCIITQAVTPWMAWQAKRCGIKIILDAYDPMPLENLERFKSLPASIRIHKNQQVVSSFTFSFQMADAFLCANTKQRDLWIGLLMGLGRITPELYDADPTLSNFIGIVPFGLPSHPPKHSGNGLRKMFNLKDDAKVMLWGGGIWNWFDPITLIKAVKQLSQESTPIHLVFMGVKHPNSKIPAMKMSHEAVQLAKDLDLMDKYVFFNFSWTPYDQRQDFLLDADIGVSTHFEHLETQYSFRTRILDYIWAGLPIIATEGDAFAEMIKDFHLGSVVPYEDTQALVKAIKEMIMHPHHMDCMRKNIENIRSQFTWDQVVIPIDRIAHHLVKQPKRQLSFNDVKNMCVSFYKTRGPRAIFNEIFYQLGANKG